MTNIKNIILILLINLFVFSNLPSFSMAEDEKDTIWIGHYNYTKKARVSRKEKYIDIDRRICQIDVDFGLEQPNNPATATRLLEFRRTNREKLKIDVCSLVTQPDAVKSLNFRNVSTDDHLALIKSTLLSCSRPFYPSKFDFRYRGSLNVTFHPGVSDDFREEWMLIEKEIRDDTVGAVGRRGYSELGTKDDQEGWRDNHMDRLQGH